MAVQPAYRTVQVAASETVAALSYAGLLESVQPTYSHIDWMWALASAENVCALESMQPFTLKMQRSTSLTMFVALL